MNNLSVSGRLVLGFAVVVALSIGLAVFQLTNFRDAIRFLDAITEDDSRVLSELNQIIRLRSTLRGLREAAIAEAALASARGTQGQVQRIQSRYGELTQALQSRIEAMENRGRALVSDGTSAERRRLWGELAGAARELSVATENITGRGISLLELLQQGSLADAMAIRRDIDVRQDALERAIQRVTDITEQLTRSGRRDILGAYREALNSAIVAIIVVSIVSATAAYVIGHSITMPLARFVSLTRLVGEGDLSQRVPQQGRGELASLGAHLNDMTESLGLVAGRTRGAAEELNASIVQIRASAQQQAAAVAEQLSAVEETNATLAEITQSGAQITERVQEVERNAQRAAGDSEQGLRAVEGTVQAMASIREQVEAVARTIVSLSERTQAIGEIILTVNAIAERAHLLALNASIEAAAAGEHGRTFSVVAGEIKRLADQSRDATSRVRANLGEIQQGINASVMLTEEAGKRVDSGRRQTEETDRTIRGMADSIHESVDAFQQIVAATNQHQIGLEQVSQALQSIRQASSQTNTTTRQLEGAAGALGELAGQLLDTVRKYRL